MGGKQKRAELIQIMSAADLRPLDSNNHQWGIGTRSPVRPIFLSGRALDLGRRPRGRFSAATARSRT
jgi:hypothetical protein